MTTPDPDRRPPARVRTWAWYGALGMLLVLTSLAVASVKAWLVIPYLALMAVILFTPPGRTEREEDQRAGLESEAGAGPGVTSTDGRPGSGVEDEAVADASAAPATVSELAGEPAEVPGPDSEPRGVKTRRGKGRGRKSKAVVESPGAAATWIQVGPGKFVRAESPGPPVVAPSPTSEGEPAGSLPPSSGTVEGGGVSDAQAPRDRDAEAPPGVEDAFAPEGEPEAWAVPAPDETDSDAPGPWHDGGNLEHAPGPDLAAGSAAAIDVALESHFEPPLPEDEPVDSWAPSSGTGAGTTVADAPVDASEVALAAEDSPPTEGGSGVWAGAAAVETAAFATVPAHVEGDLERAPEPRYSVGSAAAIDAAFASPPDAPAPPGDPDDLFVSLSGIGERSTGAPPPGDEAEAVPTAEGSFARGEASDVGDRAAPGDLSAEESASTQAGGDPGHAWQPDLAAESAGDALLGSYPDVPPPAVAEYGASEVESASEIAVERARDARDQALEEIAGALVAREIPDADPGTDATLENGPDGDVARDNGIAPDAFGFVPPAEIEDASTQDRAGVAGASAAPSDRPNRPTVGTFLASLRGLRPRVGPATATRSRPGATSPRRVVRSVRRTRVSPVLRPPSRRGPGRSRPASRTFPPRSPPVSSMRS